MMLNWIPSLKVIAAAMSVLVAADSLQPHARAEQSERRDRTSDGRSEEARERLPEHLLAGDPALAMALREYAERTRDRERAERDNAIEELMEHVRQLKMKRLDVQRTLQHAEVDSDFGRLKDLQGEMIEIEHQLQVAEIELDRVMMERDRDAERRQMLAMNERFEYVAGWRNVAFDPPQAVMMATQAIVELHLSNNDAEGAAERLEGLLEKVSYEGGRTALRFALRDVYAELGRVDKAAEQMALVILENSSALSR